MPARCNWRCSTCCWCRERRRRSAGLRARRRRNRHRRRGGVAAVQERQRFHQQLHACCAPHLKSRIDGGTRWWCGRRRRWCNRRWCGRRCSSLHSKACASMRCQRDDATTARWAHGWRTRLSAAYCSGSRGSSRCWDCRSVVAAAAASARQRIAQLQQDGRGVDEPALAQRDVNGCNVLIEGVDGQRLLAAALPLRGVTRSRLSVPPRLLLAVSLLVAAIGGWLPQPVPQRAQHEGQRMAGECTARDFSRRAC